MTVFISRILLKFYFRWVRWKYSTVQFEDILYSLTNYPFIPQPFYFSKVSFICKSWWVQKARGICDYFPVSLRLCDNRMKLKNKSNGFRTSLLANWNKIFIILFLNSVNDVCSNCGNGFKHLKFKCFGEKELGFEGFTSHVYVLKAS